MSDRVEYDIDNNPIRAGDEVVIVYVKCAENRDYIGSVFTIKSIGMPGTVILDAYVKSSYLSYPSGHSHDGSLARSKQIRLKKPPENESKILRGSLCLT